MKRVRGERKSIVEFQATSLDSMTPVDQPQHGEYTLKRTFYVCIDAILYRRKIMQDLEQTLLLTGCSSLAKKCAKCAIIWSELGSRSKNRDPVLIIAVAPV
jgi:hypothetical protein